MHMFLCVPLLLFQYSKDCVTSADTEHEVNFGDCWCKASPAVYLLMSIMHILWQ